MYPAAMSTQPKSTVPEPDSDSDSLPDTDSLSELSELSDLELDLSDSTAQSQVQSSGQAVSHVAVGDTDTPSSSDVHNPRSEGHTTQRSSHANEGKQSNRINEAQQNSFTKDATQTDSTHRASQSPFTKAMQRFYRYQTLLRDRTFGATESLLASGVPQSDHASGASERNNGAPQRDPTYGASERNHGAPQRDPTSGASERNNGAPQRDPTSGASERNNGAPQRDPTSGASERNHGAPQRDPTSGAPLRDHASGAAQRDQANRVDENGLAYGPLTLPDMYEVSVLDFIFLENEYRHEPSLLHHSQRFAAAYRGQPYSSPHRDHASGASERDHSSGALQRNHASGAARRDQANRVEESGLAYGPPERGHSRNVILHPSRFPSSRSGPANGSGPRYDVDDYYDESSGEDVVWPEEELDWYSWSQWTACHRARDPSDAKRLQDKVLTLVVNADMVKNQELCPICHADYKEGEELYELPCTHAFHQDCIRSWVLDFTKYSCPFCRQKFDLGPLRYDYE